jgi:hypothetical protein
VLGSQSSRVNILSYPETPKSNVGKIEDKKGVSKPHQILQNSSSYKLSLRDNRNSDSEQPQELDSMAKNIRKVTPSDCKPTQSKESVHEKLTRARKRMR